MRRRRPSPRVDSETNATTSSTDDDEEEMEIGSSSTKSTCSIPLLGNTRSGERGAAAAAAAAAAAKKAQSPSTTASNPRRPQQDNNPEDDDDNDLSIPRVLAAFLPLLVLTIYASTNLGLHRLAGDVLTASIRTFLQLTCLGAILTPIFGAKQHSRLGTCAYVLLFMLPLAAYEATARSPLTHSAAYLVALAGLGIGVVTSLSVAIFVVVKSNPWYSPRVVIPLGGMLLSNALSGTALAASEILNELHNRSERIDVLLAMGATPWEATWSTISSVLSKALVPTINSMNVIGLVAIPGMMTGQIFGGASPVRAARYQIMVMYLIAASTGLSAGVTTIMTVETLFDRRGVYRADLIRRNDAPGVSQLLSGSWYKSRGMKTSDNNESVDDIVARKSLAEASPVELRSEAVSSQSTSKEMPLFELDVSGTLAFGRPFSATLSLRKNEIACLLGPSGIGKSTFLQSIAELSTIGTIDDSSSSIRLNGVDRMAYSPPEWRRRVLYVPQGTASALSGTPTELIDHIWHLKAQRRKSNKVCDILGYQRKILGYLREWNVADPESAIERPWSDVSGGESQRILLACALASDSDVLLLDEPTSALDETTKGRVEATIIGLGRAILMVTHDEEQAVRLGALRWRLE